jgi:hypothetical protein
MPLKNLRLCGRSSQVVTTGAQLFDIGKATPHADSYGLKISIDGRQCVKIKGTAESEHSIICFDILNYDNFDLSGKSYKIKIFNLRGTHSIQEIYGFRTKNEKSIAVVIDVSSKKNVDITFQIMVSKEVPTKWEPYTGGKPAPSPSYPQKITDAGNDGNIVAQIEGKNLIDIESGIVAGWNINFPELKLIPGETYSLTNVNVPVNIALVEETTNTRLTVNYIASGRKDTFIMPDIPDAKIFISGTNATWNKGDLSTVKIQLELGPAATEYEPYKPAQTLIIPTPGGLPGIPVSSGGNYTDENGQQWVTDEVDLAKGVYIKRIEKIVSYNNESINGSYISETGELTVGARVLFVLDTSVETPLLPETIAAFRKLCMNYPVTTITNSDNCGMEVAYIADTKAYIDGKIAEISAAIASK